MCAVDPHTPRTVPTPTPTPSNCSPHSPDIHVPKGLVFRRSYESTLKMTTLVTLQPSVPDEDDDDDDVLDADDVPLHPSSEELEMLDQDEPMGMQDDGDNAGHDVEANSVEVREPEVEQEEEGEEEKDKEEKEVKEEEEEEEEEEEMEVVEGKVTMKEEELEVERRYAIKVKHTERTCLTVPRINYDLERIDQVLVASAHTGEKMDHGRPDPVLMGIDHLMEKEGNYVEKVIKKEENLSDKTGVDKTSQRKEKKEELQNERNEKRMKYNNERDERTNEILLDVDKDYMIREGEGNPRNLRIINKNMNPKEKERNCDDTMYDNSRRGNGNHIKRVITDILSHAASTGDATDNTREGERKFKRFLIEGKRRFFRTKEVLGDTDHLKEHQRFSQGRTEGRRKEFMREKKRRVEETEAGKPPRTYEEFFTSRRSEGHSYMVDARDLLFSSRRDMTNDYTMEGSKTWGGKVWGEREASERKKLFCGEKEYEKRDGSEKHGVKSWGMGERSKNTVHNWHERYVEKIPHHFIFLKSKTKSPFNKSEQKSASSNQCFIIGSGQYWPYVPLDSNLVSKGNYKKSQDSNNNCQKWHVKCDSSGSFQKNPEQKLLFKASNNFCKMQYMFFGDKMADTKYPKSPQRRSSLKNLIADFIIKMRSFYRICKYAGYKKLKMGSNQNPYQMKKDMEKMHWNSSHSQLVRECKSGDIPKGTPPAQQHGDQNHPANQGRRWWQTNRSSSENSQTNGDGRTNGHNGGAAKKSGANVSQAIKSTTNVRRSFDVDYRGRKRKTGSLQVFRRSISSDEDKSDDVFVRTFKYRDKYLPHRFKPGDVSSSSEDPADGLRVALNTRLSKSCERKRVSPTNRIESASKAHSRDVSRSRKRYVKVKSDQSSSSQSSSSSCSGSRSRSGIKSSVPRVKKKIVSKDVIQTENSSKAEESYDEKCNPKEFLARLDTVLSDLVESEKKKISKFGQPKLKESKHESFEDFKTRKKPFRKAETLQVKQKTSPDISKDISPSIQQLKATLRAVRVKKRSPTSGDVLDKHPERFTERLPHNPRILKTHRPSQLLTQRCYQPPRRKPTRPQKDKKDAAVDYPSDFYSSEEEHEELQMVCKDEQPSVDSTSVKHKEKSEETNNTTDEKDENDTYYGSDNLASRDYAQNSHRRMQELVNNSAQGEVGDSGEFSVDSAYTGSRGATPESVLNPSVKPRRLGGSLTTPPLPKARFYSTYRRIPCTERLIELKRNILNDIRESKLYSDESINSLLEEYKRKCCDVNDAEVQEVTLSIQEDLGVKPRPDHYVYHMLRAAEERRQGRLNTHVMSDTKHPENSGDSTTASTLTEDSDMLRASGKRLSGISRMNHNSDSRIQNEKPITRSQKPSKSPPVVEASGKSMTGKSWKDRRQRLSRQETEDKVWAEATVGEVAPGLVAQAKEEATSRAAEESDPDWSGYVADLCHQFDIKI